MNCYLCNCENFKIVNNGTRDKGNISVIKCINCGLVTLDSLKHIDESFYRDSKMHSTKIKIENWLEETKIDDDRRIKFLTEKIRNKKVLDFGCGNGGFLLKANGLTNEVVGIEPEMQFKSFFKKNNLKVFNSLCELPSDKFDLITAFHVFEHLKDPIQILSNLKSFIKTTSEIIIEVPNSEDALLTYYKSKKFANFTYWSQHLFLFNEKTLGDLFIKSNYKINWIKQIQRYPLSNHLYWLSKGLPNGHKIFTVMSETKLNFEYEKILKREKICDTLLASISLN
tara:strand:- start:792 stop:1640 length:849 start_codon:yes stop_codon:yes gene_type:complete